MSLPYLCSSVSSSLISVKAGATPQETVTYIPGGVRLESTAIAIANIANREFRVVYQKIGYQVTVQLNAYDAAGVPEDSFVVNGGVANLVFDAAALGTKISAQLLNDRSLRNKGNTGQTAISLNIIGGVFQPDNVAVLGDTLLNNEIRFCITGNLSIPVSADPYKVCSALFIAGNPNIVV